MAWEEAHDTPMISFLRGRLVRSLPTLAEIDVHGVGYETAIPLSTFDRLPATGTDVHLLVHHHVTENAHTLFGFATEEERDLFRLLIHNVSGVGPKLALAILSGMKVDAFRTAVMADDVAALARTKGLGRKTAEKIVLELRDKLGVSPAWKDASRRADLSPAAQAANDALLALIALGFKPADAQKAVHDAQQSAPGAGVEELIREALRQRS